MNDEALFSKILEHLRDKYPFMRCLKREQYELFLIYKEVVGLIKNKGVNL